uniref:Replication-associated protein n=1 Tax=Beet curly top Iran virus TaxID=391228 RepID=A0A1B0NGM4_9GEMI|nr:putative RepA [Beet curly top Iran virus]AHC03618.1 putative RepA [Beet curly top Iran virus]
MPRVARRNRPSTNEPGYLRFQKKNAFLTYSQIGGDFKDYIFEKLKALLESYVILFLAVSLEHHQPTEEQPEGGFHTHCIIQCDKKLDVNGNLFFNIILPDGRTIHPRIDGLNAPKRAFEYITKEDTSPRTFGELRLGGRSPNSIGNSNVEWRRILDSSNTKEEFFSNIRESCPTDFVLRWPSIHSFANYHFRPVVQPYTPRWTEFSRLPDQIKEWAENNIYFVSTDCLHYEICHDCSRAILLDKNMTIEEYYHLDRLSRDLACSEDTNALHTSRSQTTDPSDHEVSTSVDHPGLGKHNGQDL